MMTVDELISFLRKEWQDIEDKYGMEYESLGRRVLANKGSLECWTVKDQISHIEKMREDQIHLTTLIDNISAVKTRASRA